MVAVAAIAVSETLGLSVPDVVALALATASDLSLLF